MKKNMKNMKNVVEKAIENINGMYVGGIGKRNDILVEIMKNVRGMMNI